MRNIFLYALAAGTAIWLGGCQSTGSLGNLTGAPTDGAVTKAAYMPVGQQVLPPYGYISFCLRDRHECEGGTDTPKNMPLTPDRWTQLNEVNDYVNRNIPQIEDIDNYGVQEWWAYPNARGGDCEDLALLKRKMLIERGWPQEDLLMTVVREWNGDGHAVLVVTTDKGEYVLDNKNWAIVSWADAPYTWIKRQSQKRPYIWVDLDQRTFLTASNDAVPPLGAPIPFIAAVDKAAAAAAKPQITQLPVFRPSLAAEPDHAEAPTAALAAY